MSNVGGYLLHTLNSEIVNRSGRKVDYDLLSNNTHSYVMHVYQKILSPLNFFNTARCFSACAWRTVSASGPQSG